MEFSASLAAGVTGSLIAAVLLRFVWRGSMAAGAANLSSWSEAQFLILHAVWGVGLGLLFWLSWGLAAIVGVSWWVRGVAFGVLCGSIAAVPLLWLGRILLAWPWVVLPILVIDALGTSVLAGLLCAWSWTHNP